MTYTEMDNQFDVLFNNITSNQAPGLNGYEKSVFLTKAQLEVVKNHFSMNSRGNMLQRGFDDTSKRQADFSKLMMTEALTPIVFGVGTEDIHEEDVVRLDPRENPLYFIPDDIFIVINEVVTVEGTNSNKKTYLQVVPLRYDEYLRLMSKPFKRPLKNQAWRLLSSNYNDNKVAEIILPRENIEISNYVIRYVKRPSPIIVENLNDYGLTIEGQSSAMDCELDSALHEEIVQRAVELAKVAWVTTGQTSPEALLKVGERTE